LVSEAFLRKKIELLKRMKKGATLTEDLEKAIIDTYGPRGRKALDAVRKHKVTKRGDRWFVRGKGDEYEIVKTYCTCRDYVLNVVTEKVNVDCCYHALAKVICELLDRYYVEEREEKSR
jgi:predicted nucleic acid-binding Zn finger protein